MKRRVVLATALAAAAMPGFGQSTTRPLRFIVPTAPASGADLVARMLQPRLSQVMGGRPIVIDNLSGAGGVLGTTQLVRSAPDGNTVAIISVNHVLNGLVYKKLPYDTLADITPIVGLGSIPLVMLVNPQKVPARDLHALVALFKAQPGHFNYSSPGNGAAPHLAAKMFVDAAGVDVKHIPFRGTGPQLTAVISGDVAFTIVSASGAISHVQSGALVPVAVMSNQRLAGLPQVPTIVELGYAAAVLEAWFGIAGPAHMKADDVMTIGAAFSQAMNSPEVRKGMEAQMNVVQVSSTADWDRLIRGEYERYKSVTQGIGLTLD